MSSFLQYGGLEKPRAVFRPVLIGALTCSALMVCAGTAQADHRMADGTLCPHAAGTLAPGESPAAPTIERAASSAPVGAASSAPKAAPAARPAAKPAAKPPAQRPAVQAQAQRPAASQTQAQRPAAATQPVVSQARVSAPAQRRAQVTQPVQRQAKAGGSERRATKQPVSRPAVTPVVMPDVTTDARSASVRPTAAAVTASPADGGGAVSTVALAVLLGMCGILTAGVVAVRRRVVRVQGTASAPLLAEAADAAIEAELQQMIAETRARALSAPTAPGEAGDDRELSETR